MTAAERAPRFSGIGGHHSHRTKTTEWLTPPEIIEALGGAATFALDPCASEVRPLETARRCFTKADNGLLQRWEGPVWLNPPYGADVGAWLSRLADLGDGIALVFARTETASFVRHVFARASGILFVAGRINFLVGQPWVDNLTGRRYEVGERAPRNSGAPSVLCSYGQGCLQRLRDAVDAPTYVDGELAAWRPGRIPGTLVERANGPADPSAWTLI